MRFHMVELSLRGTIGNLEFSPINQICSVSARFIDGRCYTCYNYYYMSMLYTSRIISYLHRDAVARDHRKQPKSWRMRNVDREESQIQPLIHCHTLPYHVVGSLVSQFSLSLVVRPVSRSASMGLTKAGR